MTNKMPLIMVVLVSLLASGAYAMPKTLAPAFQVLSISSLNEDACASGVVGGYAIALQNTASVPVTLSGMSINGVQKTFCQMYGPGNYELGSTTFAPGQIRYMRVQEGYLYCIYGNKVQVNLGLNYNLPPNFQSNTLRFMCTLIPPPGPK